MRKTIHKLFWVWDFDREEAWLNAMAAQGLALISVGFCRYDFEECTPGEYGVRMELLKERPAHPESEKYIAFLEDTGAEHVGTFTKWIYLRKKKSCGEFELFSDNDSRLRHLTRIIRLILTVAVLNLMVGLNNLILGLSMDSSLNLLLSPLNLILGLLALIGCRKLQKKARRLRAEQHLFE